MTKKHTDVRIRLTCLHNYPHLMFIESMSASRRILQRQRNVGKDGNNTEGDFSVADSYCNRNSVVVPLKKNKHQTGRNNTGNFGDIMSDIENNIVSFIDSAPVNKSQILWTDASPMGLKNGLVTHTGSSLQSVFADTNLKLSALERIALTANGNLQRIFSSFYNSPVQVHVEKCERRTVENGDLLPVWDRLVHLMVHEQVFCTASSAVSVSCPHCLEVLDSGEVGIGQLFRYLDRLPTFSLLEIGRLENGCLWRKYMLSSVELECIIKEIFATTAWNISNKGAE